MTKCLQRYLNVEIYIVFSYKSDEKCIEQNSAVEMINMNNNKNR